MSEYPADDDNNTTVVLHNCTMDPTPAPAPRKRRRIRIRSSVPIVKAVPAKVSPAEAKKERAIRYQRKLEVLANKWGKVLNNMCVNYLVFVGQQGGLPSTEIVSPVAIDCQCGSEKVLLTKTVRMYFFHAIKDVSVSYCSCKPLAEALILMGMFPASPTDPKNAIHLGLLGYFNEVRNTLKSSSEGITKLYNNLQGNPLTSLSVNNFRTVFNMYNKVILLTDEMVNERSLLKDQAMCCPACPSRDSIHPMDRIFITMDGCFSMKCKSKASPLDQLNLVNTVENAWVKPECVELYKKEKAPKDALMNENTFRAAGNGASYKSKLYPVKGIFTASCARHDLTLKMVDMDSGEGFKYPLSVLHELFQEDKDSLVTPVNLMYDIICVLEKSLTTHFPYLTANGTLALPVFHAYAHVISCQSSFNPKTLNRTAGLTARHRNVYGLHSDHSSPLHVRCLRPTEG
ncbi:uncharacterized protein EV154DRAFT_571264 [Mucor mucedo]|uniref:uncharacterized protein n=1 Tax=Mucor mucedo TaxID=29922 RepID=UPI002220ACCE|nr:uncharacterized protein EV154DRAFT_571264 [Mucor mucedo]KAI7868969.1 hypothetical protein EV154DRAFT_571264 [Mucor mucedo]